MIFLSEGASGGNTPPEAVGLADCAKKIEDGQDWSLVWKQRDVEIRAHAEGCAMRVMPCFHQALRKPALGAGTPKKKP